MRWNFLQWLRGWKARQTALKAAVALTQEQARISLGLRSDLKDLQKKATDSEFNWERLVRTFRRRNEDLDVAEARCAALEKRLAQGFEAVRNPVLSTGGVTDSAPPWSDADALAWRTFLASESGRKLALTVSFWEQARNREAVMQRENHSYAAGLAAGWGKASAWIMETLSADVRPELDDDKERGDGAARDLETTAP